MKTIGILLSVFVSGLSSCVIYDHGDNQSERTANIVYQDRGVTVYRATVLPIYSYSSGVGVPATEVGHAKHKLKFGKPFYWSAGESLDQGLPLNHVYFSGLVAGGKVWHSNQWLVLKKGYEPLLFEVPETRSDNKLDVFQHMIEETYMSKGGDAERADIIDAVVSGKNTSTVLKKHLSLEVEPIKLNGKDTEMLLRQR